jgi:hypothetical protein
VCAAVGDYEKHNAKVVALAESWDGTRWTVEPTPSNGSASLLDGVSCGSSSACTSVGRYSRTTYSGSQSLAESWNGTSWRVDATPNPKNSTQSALVGVSCTSTSACTAVGLYYPHGKPQRSLVETWNGKRWAIMSTPSKADGIQLNGVSCRSRTACTAVGLYDSPHSQSSVAEAWNGRRWTIEATPNPSNAGPAGTRLNGDSCASPTSCVAVGSYYNHANDALTLAEALTGKRWSIKPTAQ